MNRAKLNDLCKQSRKNCLALICLIDHLSFKDLGDNAEDAKLSHYSVFDALLLIHPGCDVAAAHSKYVENLRKICLYFVKNKKPIFVMDDMDFPEVDVDQLLNKTLHTSMKVFLKEFLKHNSVSDDRTDNPEEKQKAVCSYYCTGIRSVLSKNGVKKDFSKIKIAIGGGYHDACVWIYGGSLCQKLHTHFPGKSDLAKARPDNAVGEGYVLDEIV